MSGKITSRLSGILEFCLSGQSDGQIIDGCHNFSHVAHGHARGIFMEGDIAATMQSVFNAPMQSTNFQEAHRCGLRSIQTGDSKFNFTGGVITPTRTEPLKVSFQSIDLGKSGPSGMGIQHFAGSNGSGLQTSVTLVHFFSSQEISLNFSKSGLGYSGANSC